MNTSVLCIYKHGFSLLVWVTDWDMRQLIWVWAWQEHVVRMWFCMCVCLSASVYFYTYVNVCERMCVCVCAFMHSSSSMVELKQKKCSLRCTQKQKTHSWGSALVHLNLRDIIKSLFYPPRWVPPPVLAATPSFVFCAIHSISAIITFYLDRGGDMVLSTTLQLTHCPRLWWRSSKLCHCYLYIPQTSTEKNDYKVHVDPSFVV